MAQIVWTSTAINDLNSIAEYIEIDSEMAAEKFTKEIISKVETLAFHPLKAGQFQKIFRVVIARYCTKVIGLFIG